MNKNLILNNNNYELVINVHEGYDFVELESKFTEYFFPFDYVLGDWAYGKLRLKGFYDLNNKEVKDYNNYSTINTYIENNCAYDCKYFIIKKIN